MPAKSPEEICALFRKYMKAGNLEGLISIYDAEAVFLNQSGEIKEGRQQVREELAHFAANRTVFDYNIKQVVRSGDIALMHTEWEVGSTPPTAVYAIEVARRAPDGIWCWLIGDPFTVGRKGRSRTSTGM